MPPFPLPVTAWTAVLLGALFIWLTFRVIGQRRAQKIVYGDGGDKVMLKRMRGQGNAAEQIPLGLILLALSEALHGSGWIALTLAALLIVGRTSHGVFFAVDGLPHQMRLLGMTLTMLAQIGGVIAVAAGLIAG